MSKIILITMSIILLSGCTDYVRVDAEVLSETMAKCANNEGATVLELESYIDSKEGNLIYVTCKNGAVFTQKVKEYKGE